MAPNPLTSSPIFINPPKLQDPEFYSHAVSVGSGSRLVLTSGQVGGRKDGTFPNTFKEQVEQAFQNLEDVLHAAGAQIRDVIKLKWYCVNWSAEESFQSLLNSTFAFLTDKYGVRFQPLTTLVPVPALAFPHIKFEVEATAAVGGSSQALIPAPDAGKLRPPPRTTDIVVVGGGFSGLQAAYDLHQAGHQVLVLEAKHRVGGRSWTIPLKSGKGNVELGATWINKRTQPKIYDLVQRFGLDVVEQYAKGDAVYQDCNGHIFRTNAMSLPEDKSTVASPGSNFNLKQMFDEIELLEHEIDLRDTTKFLASEDVSVDAWIKQKQFTPFAADYLRAFVRGIVCREPEEVGIHYAMDYIKSGGGFVSLFAEGPEGAQELKVKQGTSAIADGLAGALPSGSVMLNSPVDSITQYGRTVLVGTSHGLVVEAKKAIIAIPTHVYDKIHFSPLLPYAKRAIVSRTKPGNLAKVIITYSRPWWRDIGLAGIFQSFTGPICLSWEISNFADKQYSLALFLCGEAESKWEKLSALAREEAPIDHLAEFVGGEHAHLAREVLEINEQIWTQEEYIEGAPTSAIGPQDLSRFGHALRTPFKNLFFGGGETAFEWKGYMEGALRAGSRVASEVALALEPGSKL